MEWQKDKQTLSEQLDGKRKRKIEKKDRYSHRQADKKERQTDRQMNKLTERDMILNRCYPSKLFKSICIVSFKFLSTTIHYTKFKMHVM